jgi:hypothetical protein
MAAALAFALYLWSMAPGLTWAHYGTDGGELLAAAVVNGVPHPPGYPLYTLLLQIWLALGAAVFPNSSLARLGNLWSATCAAASVGVTVLAARRLFQQVDSLGRLVAWSPGRCHGSSALNLTWAILAGLLWAISPLLWSQALITEVYALHALLVALTGWALLAQKRPLSLLALLFALGLANHLTFVLLLPAVAYSLWSTLRGPTFWRRMGGLGVVAFLLGAAFYGRIPLVASGSMAPPPVNWGYADNWRDFWWLISGAAYQRYLSVFSPGTVLSRVAVWAYTLVVQFTPIGFGLVLIGLSYLDRHAPRLRNLGLLWITPFSLSAVLYATRDSQIYLLPVVWLCALWLALGCHVGATRLFQRWPWMQAHSIQLAPLWTAGVVLLFITLRFPAISLRQEMEAQKFLASAQAIIEPSSIVISDADAETFALWYGAWASGDLLQRAPGIVLVNYSLYQFPWYRRLLRDLYPAVPGVGDSVEQLISLNQHNRPIFFSEKLPWASAEQLQPAGNLWRYVKQ